MTLSDNYDQLYVDASGLLNQVARQAEYIRELSAVARAADDMLNFGKHDGRCTQHDNGAPCDLHLGAMEHREKRLREALEPVRKRIHAELR